MLHPVGCLYYLYQWCTVKQISDNEVYLLIKCTQSVLWRVAKRLSYMEDTRCLKLNYLWKLRNVMFQDCLKYFCKSTSFYKKTFWIFDLYPSPQIRLLQNFSWGSKLLSWMINTIITNQYSVWKFKQHNGRCLYFAREIFFIFPFLISYRNEIYTRII